METNPGWGEQEVIYGKDKSESMGNLENATRKVGRNEKRWLHSWTPSQDLPALLHQRFAAKNPSAGPSSFSYFLKTQGLE